MKDLISQMNHPSSKTRKEAILGLKELLQAYPNLLSEQISLIMDGTVKRIVDEVLIINDE